MSETDFFEKPTEASKLKAKLVADYFDTWSNIILPSVRKTYKRFAYIDFYSGPGVYKDGTPSTPLLVLEKAIKHEEKQKMLVSIFNDSNPKNLSSLEKAIKALPGYGHLNYEPEIRNIEIRSESTIIEELGKIKLVPTLFFIDPFGYEGLSLNLIRSVLKDWGSDGIFFFNYLRINMALSNLYLTDHMKELFGAEKFKELRAQIDNLSPLKRERLILDKLVNALNDIGGNFVLDFRFPQYGGLRTSHYLIFVSKHIKGYKVMKEILAKNSSSYDQGVASFEYNPTSQSQLPLRMTKGPLDKLEEMLLTEFKDQTLTMQEIYDRHDIGKHFTRYYIENNYKDALRNLENRGFIKCDPPASKRPKRYGKVTFGPNTVVKFKK
jgi:three-Cys-motif partner protein